MYIYDEDYFEPEVKEDKPEMAIAAFIVGIFSVVLCCYWPIPTALGIVAIVLANKGIKVTTTQKNLASWGRALGIVALVLQGCWLLFFIFTFAMRFLSFFLDIIF